MESDIIVEITGDCPITDPQIVDLGVQTFFAMSVDVVTNSYIFHLKLGQWDNMYKFLLINY